MFWRLSRRLRVEQSAIRGVLDYDVDDARVGRCWWWRREDGEPCIVYACGRERELKRSRDRFWLKGRVQRSRSLHGPRADMPLLAGEPTISKAQACPSAQRNNPEHPFSVWLRTLPPQQREACLSAAPLRSLFTRRERECVASTSRPVASSSSDLRDSNLKKHVHVLQPFSNHQSRFSSRNSPRKQ